MGAFCGMRVIKLSHWFRRIPTLTRLLARTGLWNCPVQLRIRRSAAAWKTALAHSRRERNGGPLRAKPKQHRHRSGAAALFGCPRAARAVTDLMDDCFKSSRTRVCCEDEYQALRKAREEEQLERAARRRQP
jgi:hypothetical protein